MQIRHRALAVLAILVALALLTPSGEAGRGRAKRLRGDIATLKAKVAQLESMANFQMRQRLHPAPAPTAAGPCTDACAEDADGDGSGDCEDPCPCDPENADTDTDSASDCIDPCPTDATDACIDPCRMDSDADGAHDCEDPCPYDPSAGKDGDGDDIPDCTDPCPQDAGNRCIEPCPLDSDGDGVQDCTDPCPWGEATGMPCVFPPKDGEPCRATGCSGQVCADHGVVTTCEWREEYACYGLSRCERQADGQCGFTPTAELAACLAGDEPCGRPGKECPATRWFWTCGDPVCRGHQDDPTIPDCAADQTPRAPCSPAGTTCDPGDGCNRLLRCATSDPTGGGLCPISRRHHKQDISYLGDEDLQRVHDALMSFRLTTYRYRHEEDAARRHLGFIIEDVEPSPSVDPGRDVVDLYGYTSMAVAALQRQAQEIAQLKRETAALRSALEVVR